jgi:subtilase family serine protease
MRLTFVRILVLLLLLSCTYFFAAQRTARISQRIDNNRVSTVRGNLHRFAQPAFDRGAAEDSLPIERMTLALRSTPEQEAELEELLQQQQDPASPNYHQWLSPEEFADRFGVPSAEFERVTEWLQSQGFTIAQTARSRRWISFTGTVREVNAAFHANMHAYQVGGQRHYANALEPTVPTALRDLVIGFHHMNDFRIKPRIHRSSIRPDFTSEITGNHFIAPDDFATIYDLQPLYKAGIDGTGQSIAIMGETDILLSDIRAFRAASGLPSSDPQVVLVPGSRDPGINPYDVDEASLDIEWAGAVARNATIIYVNSGVDVFDSFTYAIDQNIAPVVSISYGQCEALWTAADLTNFRQLTQQANAQGMTISTPSGDEGAADCDSQTSTQATTGLGVDFPASSPYVTAVGGTTINSAGNVWNSTTQIFGTLYGKPQPPLWSTTNNSANGSAVSYISEITWNDTTLAGTLTAAGGGKSTQFAKPIWQAGVGVPNDNARDVPDISFAASPFINPYLMCSQSSCVNGFRASDTTLNIVGGTSAGTPAFAGVVALINQKTNARQGNVNPRLYQLAASAPSAFHDITGGGNAVPCQTGSRNCGANGYLGYAAAPGYDLATGLGSLDVFKLLTAW